MTPGSIRTPTGMKSWSKLIKVIHEVRAVATKTGYKYYFDKQGGAYIWYKDQLRKQHPIKLKNPKTLEHNRDGGYMYLTSMAGACNGIYNRGSMYVHRGVALAYPEICGLPDLINTQVDHKNNNKYDNRAKNLQWLSPSENTKKRTIQKKSI